VDDEFMFGPSLLVAPVATHGERSRPVYLPAGASWRDAWTGSVFDGGQLVTADAPLSRIPVFLRDDASVPIAG
jgi:alpha-D-xyloside xylohydrolase